LWFEHAVSLREEMSDDFFDEFTIETGHEKVGRDEILALDGVADTEGWEAGEWRWILRSQGFKSALNKLEGPDIEGVGAAGGEGDLHVEEIILGIMMGLGCPVLELEPEGKWMG
jgi:hypothetical protein